MSACGSLAKCILLFVNVIFLLAGLLLLGVGIAILVAFEKLLALISASGLDITSIKEVFGGFFNDIVNTCGIALIVIGGVLTLIAFFGFFGACCNNKCMLGTYSAILIVVILVEVALVIFVAVYPDELKKLAHDATKKALKEGFKSDITVENGKFQNSTNPVDVAWMAVQFKLECCGASNTSDYGEFTWTRLKCIGTGCSTLPTEWTEYKVPISCCKLKAVEHKIPSSLSDFSDMNSCLANADTASTNQKGCTTAIIEDITEAIDGDLNIAIGVTAGILAIEVLLVVFAFVLCCCNAKSSSGTNA